MVTLAFVAAFVVGCFIGTGIVYMWLGIINGR